MNGGDYVTDSFFRVFLEFYERRTETDKPVKMSYRNPDEIQEFWVNLLWSNM